MLAKPWSKKYKLCGEDMTLSFAAAEHGFGTYIPQHPKNILSLWGSLPEFGWKYGDDEDAIHKNTANVKAMINFIEGIRTNDWKCLLEQNPKYREEFLSVVGQITKPDESRDLLQAVKTGVKNLLPLLNRKQVILLGEKKYAPLIQNLFNSRAEDYRVLENEKNEIEAERLLKMLRRGAVHVFFVDIYENIKDYLEQQGLREGVDFTDGRGLLVATMD